MRKNTRKKTSLRIKNKMTASRENTKKFHQIQIQNKINYDSIRIFIKHRSNFT